MIDDDTLQAVRNLWQTSGLSLPELPKTGRLESFQPVKADGSLAPYAVLISELSRRESAGTGGAVHDFRKVTIRVFGVKADVVGALGQINGMVGVQLVPSSSAGETAGPTLLYPSGARFLRWWTGAAGLGDKLSQDPTTKQGQDVWIGEHVAEVWSVRQG